MAVGADRDSAAVTQEIRKREKPVSKVRFGTRANTDYCGRLRKRPRLLEVHVSRMHEAPLRIDIEVLEQPAHGAPLVGCHALIDFALLLGDVQMNRTTVFSASCRDFVQR